MENHYPTPAPTPETQKLILGYSQKKVFIALGVLIAVGIPLIFSLFSTSDYNETQKEKIQQMSSPYVERKTHREYTNRWKDPSTGQRRETTEHTYKLKICDKENPDTCATIEVGPGAYSSYNENDTYENKQKSK